jgi:cobalt/nickel transport protein
MINKMRALLCVGMVLALISQTAQAHFHILLPQAPAVKRGEPVTVTYEWGHAFEHHLLDAPAPESVQVIGPDGRSSDLTKNLEKVRVAGAEGKQVAAYRLRFTPPLRGDYTFVLRTCPIWIDDDEVFLQDIVKVVLHVQAQKGWDAVAPATFQLVPLTRPYGLQPGLVFQARTEGIDQPLKGAPVEIERYNAMPPKEMPPDEQITRTAKTDPNGVLTCTLTEPGWWAVTVQRDAGTHQRNGKTYPLRQRATFWVHVADRLTTGGK